jgi:hypothetical protein
VIVTSRRPGIFGVTNPFGITSIHDQGGCPLGIRRGEQGTHRSPFGDAQQGGPLRADGVYDRPDIIHPHLKGRQGVIRNAIRQTCAALVENDEPSEGGETLEKSRLRRQLPLLFKM